VLKAVFSHVPSLEAFIVVILILGLIVHYGRYINHSIQSLTDQFTQSVQPASATQ
jgi:hypothetical protein